MPRKGKPKEAVHKCKAGFEDDVRKAIRDRQKGMSLREAAQKHGISKSALQRYDKEHAKTKQLTIVKKGGQPALSAHQENELVKCLVTCAEWGSPLTTYDLRCLVKSFLDKNEINVPRFQDNFPGYDWAISFLTRQQLRLSQRKGRKNKLILLPGQSVTAADREHGSDANRAVLENDVEPMIDEDYTAEPTEFAELCEVVDVSAAPEINDGHVYAEVKSISLTVDSWVKVEFCRGKSNPQLVGQVLSKLDGEFSYAGTFLRQSSRKANVFVSPNVPDEREFLVQNVVAVLEPPIVHRSRYIFKQDPLI